MKIMGFLVTFFFSIAVWSQVNVEIQARYVKDNDNFIYMASKTENLKIKKAELTKEGVQQILKNKDKDLTLFIPEKSIVSRSVKSDEEPTE